MDPDAVWKILLEDLAALKNNPDDRTTRTRAIDGLLILARWLRSGGFAPTIRMMLSHHSDDPSPQGEESHALGTQTWGLFLLARMDTVIPAT